MEQSINSTFHFTLNSGSVLDVARGFIGETFCTQPSSSSPLALVQPIHAAVMVIHLEGGFGAVKISSATQEVTVKDQKEASGGLPWVSLYIFGLGQDLEICSGFGRVHFLLMAMVALYLPTSVFSEPAAASQAL